jgi:glycosyltransferase involved in cell wall biosynthesis
LLLVGGFGYPPNRTAAVRLVEEVLPLVRSRVPEASVTLVGRDLDPELVTAWRGKPVRWLGVVDDLTPVYARAGAVVLPYDPSTMTGTPLKIAEALANGVPVAATTNATRELGLEHGRHVLNGETSEEMAAAVVELLQNREKAHALAAAAHRWARETLSPEAIARRLATESILGSAPEQA